MADNSTFVKIDRNILRWGWYKDINTFKLFIHLILSANVKQAKWQDIVVKRGQLVTSVNNLSAQTGLSVRAVRTALEHLKSTNEVTSESTSRYTLITVVNYSAYQDKPTNRLTNERQTSDKPTTNERQQSKNNKKEDTNVSSKNEKKGADAPTPAAREWELQRNIPQDYWGVFPSEEFFDEWWAEHKCGTS